MPEGSALPENDVSPQDAAAFLAQLHNNGFHFQQFDARALAVGAKGIALLDPLLIAHSPGSASHAQRLRDLHSWSALAAASEEALETLLDHYLPLVRQADAASFRHWLANHPARSDNAIMPVMAAATFNVDTAADCSFDSGSDCS
jgi:hypothetical protein